MDNFRDGATSPSEIEALRRELAEARAELAAARDEKAAAAEVLRIVSQSATDATPVFDAILEACQRLFSPYGAAIYLVDAETVRGAARRGFVERDWGTDAMPLAGSATGRAIAEGRPVHILDLAEVESLPEDKRAAVRAYGGLTTLYVPMISRERGVGSLVVARRPKRPFSDDEIASLAAFADQAVIAIENARLLRETQEALAQQTATADVLKAINRSAFDPHAVLEALINSAVSLTGSTNGLIWRYENGLMHARAFAHGERRDAFIAHMRAHPQAPGRGSAVARIAQTGEIQNIPDVFADLEFPEELRRAIQTRATLGVPMKRGDDLVGAIVMSKPEAGAYPDRIVELVKTFADQAVIAIENARLFEEVQGRTREVEEALAQQTATSEVLKVISRSPSDLKPVLDAIADTAARLCGSEMTMFFRFDGEAFRILASWNFPPDVQAMLEAKALAPGHPSAIGRAGTSLKPVYIPDVLLDPDYGLGAEQSRALYRATLAVPMLREGRLVGALSLNRSEPGSFTPSHIALVSTFADQAAIAFENVRLFEEVKSRTRDLEEALAQQTATANALKVISRSTLGLHEVMQTLIDSAVRLCADDGVVYLRKGEVFLAEAAFDADADKIRARNRTPRAPGRGSMTGRVALSGEIEFIPDTLDDAEFEVAPDLRLKGIRSLVGVPLKRDGRVEGVFILGKREPGRFGARAVELARTFADQAVIVIENVRLFEEVQARTLDLTEALKRQTATSEILRVISQSATDAKPVFDRVVETATQLLRCDLAFVMLTDGEEWWGEALAVPEGLVPRMPRVRHPVDAAANFPARAILSKAMLYLPDWSEIDLPPHEAWVQSHYGINCSLCLPFLSGGECIGVLVLASKSTNAFNPADVAQAESFRDQAVIAIQNARSFNETKEALERQTATAEVLKVISRSAFDLQKVFETLLKTALELVGGVGGAIALREGDRLRFRAGASPKGDLPLDFVGRVIDIDRSSAAGRVMTTGRTEYIPDAAADPEFHAVSSDAWGRSYLGVPLMRDGEPEGALTLIAERSHAFSARHIELVETFADQAVIAIGNTRLFDEVQARTSDLEEALAQQTATADVLKTISRSVFDLDAVLQTLIDTAVRLARGSRGTIFIRDGEVLRARAFHSKVPPSLKEFLTANPIPLNEKEPIAKAVREGRLIHVPDMSVYDTERVRRTRSLAGFGAALWVPLMRDGEAIGLFGVPREEAVAFNEREIELVRTFADQAVIAIENARLFAEVQARTRELEQSLADLGKAQDRLVQSEKLASLGQLTAGIAHEIKNPLNFVNNFAALSRDLIAEMKEALARGDSADVEELTGLIDSNLEKVVHHGRRADSIVKNMLLHSREGSGTRSRVAVNAMIEEALNLAYHGARAEKPGFNVTIEKALDPATGEADLYLQEVTRVLLNLISNGFYSTALRRETEGPGYEPTLKATTRPLGERIEIRIRDNGVGVSDEVRAKMFNPFFTTKPAGEGTGLGLSLSHDIVVKQHGGTLEVQSRPGEFAEFILTLPRSAP